MRDGNAAEAEEQRESSRAAHLAKHRFRPGQSGNPGGKRKGQSLTARIASILAGNTLGGKRLPEGQTVADLLALAIVREALKGKFPFAREVLERLDGKVPDRIAGHDGGAIGSEDLSGLTDDELLQLQRLAAKLIVRPDEGPEGAGPGD